MKLNLEKVKLLMASNCLSIRGLSEKSGINYITLVPYLNVGRGSSGNHRNRRLSTRAGREK